MMGYGSVASHWMVFCDGLGVYSLVLTRAPLAYEGFQCMYVMYLYCSVGDAFTAGVLSDLLVLFCGALHFMHIGGLMIHVCLSLR